MKTYALTTDEGTAAHESCLCEKHFTEDNKIIAEKNALSDVSRGYFTDVSENSACNCIICIK